MDHAGGQILLRKDLWIERSQERHERYDGLLDEGVAVVLVFDDDIANAAVSPLEKLQGMSTTKSLKKKSSYTAEASRVLQKLTRGQEGPVDALGCVQFEA